MGLIGEFFEWEKTPRGRGAVFEAVLSSFEKSENWTRKLVSEYRNLTIRDFEFSHIILSLETHF